MPGCSTFSGPGSRATGLGAGRGGRDKQRLPRALLGCRDGKDLGQHHMGPSSLQKGKLRPRGGEGVGKGPMVRHCLHRLSHSFLTGGAVLGEDSQAKHLSPQLIRKSYTTTQRTLPTGPCLTSAACEVGTIIPSVHEDTRIQRG